MKNKVVFIVGPTGVGKTAFGLKLAQKCNGSIVSADSVQVYKGLDIVSGKDLPKTSKFVPLPQLTNDGFNTGYFIHNDIGIFLLDIVEPTSSFSVSQFHTLASKSIDYIISSGKIPIVVGGTGLYVQALLNGLDTIVQPDFELRDELGRLEVSALQKLLPMAQLLSLNNSDKNNKRRLIRAIEIHKSKLLSEASKYFVNHKSSIKNQHFESLVIGLECNREILKQRIDLRVDERLKQRALDEAKKLFANYEVLAQQVKNANGYKQLFQYIKKELSYDESIYRWKISEYRHAKNQMTWFRKYGKAVWFDVTEKGFENKIENSTKKFLNHLL